MAKLIAYQEFDLEDLDFNRFLRGQTDFKFFDDAYDTYRGVRYEDVLIIDYSIGGNLYEVAIAGEGIVWDADLSEATSGTIQAMGELVWNGSGYDWLYALSGVALRAEDVFAAMSTAQFRDDTIIIQTALDTSDRMVLSRFDDKASGFSGTDHLDGKAGHDVLVGHAGHDRLLGRNGNDELYGGAGRDTLLGGRGGDDLFGGNGGDSLFGGRGHDVLAGHGGADRIIGGPGRDFVDGGGGNDILSGGRGKDVFFFWQDNGSDMILDFDPKRDLIAIGDTATEFDQLDLKQDANDAVIEFANVSIRLLSLDVGELSPDNFFF